MSMQTLDTKILAAAGTIFNQTGYAGSDLETIAYEASIDLDQLEAIIESKEELCVAWLSDIHQRSEERHEGILNSDLDPLAKVENYFMHLMAWMQDYNFEGCPFTNTANTLGQSPSELIQNEIKTHKNFVKDFFVTISAEFTSNADEADKLGRQLFLLYSAGTTEAKNLQELWPIERACELALAACQFAATNRENH